MPDRMMNLMPPFISPCEKAGPVAMSPPMAAPKMPPSRAAPIVLARHETGLRGLPPSSAAAAGAEVGEGVAGAMPAAGAVGEGTCAMVERTRGRWHPCRRRPRRSSGLYIGGVAEEEGSCGEGFDRQGSPFPPASTRNSALPEGTISRVKIRWCGGGPSISKTAATSTARPSGLSPGSNPASSSTGAADPRRSPPARRPCRTPSLASRARFR